MDSIGRGRHLARFFSRDVVRSVAKNGCHSEVVASLRKFLGPNARGSTIGSLFDDGFRELNKSYRCEYVYKAHIVNKLVFGRHSPRTASVQIELQVGKSIADIVVFNGTSTAYEIKTEFDTSRRLETQSADYLKVFDNVYVVTHPHFAEKYSDIVPGRVGVIALTARDGLSECKPAISNVDSVNSKSVFRIMRQLEYMRAVVNAYGEQPSIPNGMLFKHYEALFSQLSSRDAHAALVSAFKARTTSTEMVDYLKCLPASLRVLGYATPLSALQRNRVSQVMAHLVNN